MLLLHFCEAKPFFPRFPRTLASVRHFRLTAPRATKTGIEGTMLVQAGSHYDNVLIGNNNIQRSNNNGGFNPQHTRHVTRTCELSQQEQLYTMSLSEEQREHIFKAGSHPEANKHTSNETET